MRCSIVLAGCLLALAALSGGWSAGPGGRGPATKVAKKANLSLPEKLARTVDFKGIDDPRTNLQDALEGLTKDHGVPFTVNERAFKYEQLNDVCRTAVAETPIPPMRASLRRVVEKLLSRIGVPSGATYLVRSDVIEVTTGTFARSEVWAGYRTLESPEEFSERYVGPMFPLVHGDYKARPLSEVLHDLAEQADCNIFLDPSAGEAKASARLTLSFRNVPFDTAVLLLAETAGLCPLRLDNVFILTTEAKAKKLEAAHKKWRPED